MHSSARSARSARSAPPALFTHRVRITAATELDGELHGWLATAYNLAG
jgi:hypothetical protein